MLTLNPVMGQLQAGRPLAPAFTLNPVDGSGPVDTSGGGIDTGIVFPLFGSTGGGGGGGGPSIGVNLPGGGGTTTTTTSTSSSSSPCGILNPGACVQQWVQGLIGTFACSVEDFLLRIALFVLGLMCIAGAFYFYKGSNPIIQIPGNVVRGTVRVARTAAEAGAEA